MEEKKITKNTSEYLYDGYTWEELMEQTKIQISISEDPNDVIYPCFIQTEIFGEKILFSKFINVDKLTYKEVYQKYKPTEKYYKHKLEDYDDLIINYHGETDEKKRVEKYEKARGKAMAHDFLEQQSKTEFYPILKNEELELSYQHFLRACILEYGYNFLLNTDVILTGKELKAKTKKKITFHLEKATKKGLGKLYADFYYLSSGTRFTFNLNMGVNPDYWDQKIYRIHLEKVKKFENEAELKRYENISNTIQFLEKEVIIEYHDYLDEYFHDPSFEELKAIIEKRLAGEKVITATEEIKKERQKKVNNPILLEAFQHHLDIIKIKKAINTVNNSNKMFIALKRFLIKNGLEKITSKDFDDELIDMFIEYMADEMEIMNTTINLYLQRLKIFYKSIEIDKKLPKLEDIERSREFLNTKQIEIFKNINPGNDEDYILAYNICLFVMYQGLRISDVYALTKNNINYNYLNEDTNEYQPTIELQSQKTRNHLVIPLWEEAEEILKKYDYNLNFKNFGGLKTKSINDFIKVLLKRTGLFDQEIQIKSISGSDVENVRTVIKKRYELFSIHLFRHSFASWHYSQGLPIATIQYLLGHKSQDTTKKYLHLDANSQINSVRKFYKDKEVK